MKKTLLALAVLAASSSVSAAEIYGSETSKVSVKGEVDAYLATGEVEKFDDTKDEKDADIYTWAKIQMDAEHQLNADFKAFASFEIETKDIAGGDSTAKFDDVYVGVKTDSWGVAVGEVGYLAESLDAIQKDDISNEGNYMGSTGGHHRESAGHGAVFKGEFIEGLVLVADVNTTSDKDVDNTYGISADYSFSNYSIGASFLTGDAEKDVDYSVMGVSASAEFGGLYLAATFASYEGNKGYGYWDSANYQSGTTMGVAAAYQLDKTRLYTTYAIANADEDTKTGASLGAAEVDMTNLVVGVDYAVLDNITIFAEYQMADYDSVKTYDASTTIAGVYYAF